MRLAYRERGSMNAKTAKSAKARATIAARLLKTSKGDLGRPFDDCFEMGDGAEVKRLLIERAKTDPELLYAFRYRHSQHIPQGWYEEARGEKSDADVFYAARR